MFAILIGVAGRVVASAEGPLERLEAQICEGAAHLAAGVGRWLLLVGEFDARKGYERWECRTTGFWLNLHCGISVRTGQTRSSSTWPLASRPPRSSGSWQGASASTPSTTPPPTR